MRYIADSDGYVKEVSFGADIVCGDATCTLYEGEVPTGYTSLEAWALEEMEKLYRWKIVDGNLTLDGEAVAPTELTGADYVIATGIKGIWTYRKWASGIAECWGSCTQKQSAYAAGLWVIGNKEISAYPFTFTDVPCAIGTVRYVGTGLGYYSYDYGYLDYFSGIVGTVSSIPAGTSLDISVFAHVTGRWK